MAVANIPDLDAIVGNLADDDLIELYDVSAGKNVKVTKAQLLAGLGAGGGHIIENDGVPLPQRNTLNFQSFIIATDNGLKTEVNIPVLDEDDMASDSPVHLATQQSIKAYVDNQPGGIPVDDLNIDLSSSQPINTFGIREGRTYLNALFEATEIVSINIFARKFGAAFPQNPTVANVLPGGSLGGLNTWINSNLTLPNERGEVKVEAEIAIQGGTSLLISYELN